LGALELILAVLEPAAGHLCEKSIRAATWRRLWRSYGFHSAELLKIVADRVAILA